MPQVCHTPHPALTSPVAVSNKRLYFTASAGLWWSAAHLCQPPAALLNKCSQIRENLWWRRCCCFVFKKLLWSVMSYLSPQHLEGAALIPLAGETQTVGETCSESRSW